MTYAPDVKEGKKLAIARLITLIENDDPSVEHELEELYDCIGDAHIIGVTGAPGSGKSTLVNKLAAECRKLDKKVGIISVDPTSPYTGGALLGDRVRMHSLYLDEGVFIRSMATRGSLGGLANATYDAVKVLDAAGYDYIFIETVGVGQSEVEIANVADTTLVLLTPGYGDGVQAMKAGLMEIADIFVVNKSDREGADKVVRDIEYMLGFTDEENKPGICKTSAQSGDGIPELREEIDAHMDYLLDEGLLEERRKRRIEHELVSHLTSEVQGIISKKVTPDVIDKIHKGELNPYSFVRKTLKKYRRR